MQSSEESPVCYEYVFGSFQVPFVHQERLQVPSVPRKTLLCHITNETSQGLLRESIINSQEMPHPHSLLAFLRKSCI